MLGPVYRAYQPDPGRLVAVKQFKLDLPPETAHRVVAALERLIAANLMHLGLAAPLSTGLTDSTPFLALDFVAAESFDVVIRDYGPAPVVEALRIATQLGSVLDYAAAAGVCHGALHPRDVLVSPDETRLTGVGIAQVLDEVGLIPPVRRPYTAPERVAGLAWDRRADVFSLAALIFELLFGRRIAGTGDSAVEGITKIDGTNPDDLRTLFRTALAEQPGQRFATALDFAAALQTELSTAEPGRAARGRRRRTETASTIASRVIPGRTGRLSLPLETAPDVEVIPVRTKADLDAAAADPLATLGRADAAAETPTAPGVAVPLVPPAEAPVPPAHVDLPLTLSPGSATEQGVEPTIDFSLPAGFTEAPATEEDGLVGPQTRRSADAAVPEASLAPDTLPLLHEADLSVPLTELRLVSDGRRRLASLDEDDMPLRVARERRRASDRGRGDERPLDFGVVAPPRRTRWGLWGAAAAVLLSLGVGYTFGYQRGLRDNGAVVLGTAPVTPVPATPVVPRPTDSPTVAAPEAAVGVGTSASTPASAPAPADVVPAAADPVPGGAAAVPSRPAAADTAPAAETTAPVKASRPPAAHVQLVLDSTPTGAQVTVDGRDAGTTPLSLGSLRRGTHTIRFAHQGYVTAQRRVRIRTAQPAQSIDVTLVEARAAKAATPAAGNAQASGALTVDSRPVGARVFVDGKPVGTTPVQVGALEAGGHTVRLERDGYRSWTRTVRVRGGSVARVSGSLQK